MVTEILKPYLEEHGALLSEKQLSQLESYARLLTEWNEKMNLTAIVDEEGIALKHFLDSLALLRHAEIRGRGNRRGLSRSGAQNRKTRY